MERAALVYISNRKQYGDSMAEVTGNVSRTLRAAGYVPFSNVSIPNERATIESTLSSLGDDSQVRLVVILRDLDAMDNDQTWPAMKNVCDTIHKNWYEDPFADIYDEADWERGLQGGALVVELMKACGFSSKNFERFMARKTENAHHTFNMAALMDDLGTANTYQRMRFHTIIRRARTGLRGQTLYIALPIKPKPLNSPQYDDAEVIRYLARAYA